MDTQAAPLTIEAFTAEHQRECIRCNVAPLTHSELIRLHRKGFGLPAAFSVASDLAAGFEWEGALSAFVNANAKTLKETSELGGGWYGNAWSDGSFTLRHPDNGQRIDVTASEAARFVALWQAATAGVRP